MPPADVRQVPPDMFEVAFRVVDNAYDMAVPEQVLDDIMAGVDTNDRFLATDLFMRAAALCNTLEAEPDLANMVDIYLVFDAASRAPVMREMTGDTANDFFDPDSFREAVRAIMN